MFLEDGMGSIKASFLIWHYVSHQECLLNVNFFFGEEGSCREEFLLHIGQTCLSYFQYVGCIPLWVHPAKFCPYAFDLFSLAYMGVGGIN